MKPSILSGGVNAGLIVILFVALRATRELNGVADALYISNFYLFGIVCTILATLKIEYSDWAKTFAPLEFLPILYLLSFCIAVAVGLSATLYKFTSPTQFTWETMLAISLVVANASLYAFFLISKRMVLASTFRTAPFVIVTCTTLATSLTISESLILVEGTIAIAALVVVLPRTTQIGWKTIKNLSHAIRRKWAASVSDALNFFSANSLFYFFQFFLTAEMAQNVFEYSRLVGAPWNLLLFPIAQRVIFQNITSTPKHALSNNSHVVIKKLAPFALMYTTLALLGFFVLAKLGDQVSAPLVETFDLLMFAVVAMLTIPRATIGVAIPNLFLDPRKSRLLFIFLVLRISAWVLVFPFLSDQSLLGLMTSIALIEFFYLVSIYLLLRKSGQESPRVKRPST
ncbi:hypothetical protein RHODOSMS8_03377 [Rhodobiaceae bacterium]|nr:hypothetical protein RHODOSMS8_03377 [Rhodobiaceae bacterium]